MKHKELRISMKHNDFITRTEHDRLSFPSSTQGNGNRKATQSKVLGISQYLSTSGSKRIKW